MHKNIHMSDDLVAAIKVFGLDTAAFPSVIETGGYSDDCHSVGAIGPAVAIGFDEEVNKTEYSPKAVRIDLGDGRSIVLVSTYGSDGKHNDWTTHIAVPDGCTITAKLTEDEEAEG